MSAPIAPSFATAPSGGEEERAVEAEDGDRVYPPPTPSRRSAAASAVHGRVVRAVGDGLVLELERDPIRNALRLGRMNGPKVSVERFSSSRIAPRSISGDEGYASARTSAHGAASGSVTTIVVAAEIADGKRFDGAAVEDDEAAGDREPDAEPATGVRSAATKGARRCGTISSASPGPVSLTRSSAR